MVIGAEYDQPAPRCLAGEYSTSPGFFLTRVFLGQAAQGL